MPWYSRLTRDRQFLEEITRVLVQVIQRLEDRLSIAASSGQLALLLTNDAPRILQSHYSDYHTAETRVRCGDDGNIGFEQLFLRSRPHIAFDPADDASDPKLPYISAPYMHALVDNLLADLLSPQDYRSQTERAIIREILVYVIFTNLFTRLAKPWFIHSIIIKLLAPPATAPKAENATPPPSLLEKCGHLWSLVATYLTSLSLTLLAASVQTDHIWPIFSLAATALRTSERPILAQILWCFRVACSLVYSQLNK